MYVLSLDFQNQLICITHYLTSKYIGTSLSKTLTDGGGGQNRIHIVIYSVPDGKPGWRLSGFLLYKPTPKFDMQNQQMRIEALSHIFTL